jgi:hypothetical protein
MAHRRQWSVPAVGPLQPSFDRVDIVSSARVGKLKSLLPIAGLNLTCHTFKLRTYRGRDPRLHSRLILVCSHATNPWPILARHEAVLELYWITRAEIAFDAEAASIDVAHDRLFALVGQLGKRWHQRGHVFSVHKPDDTPPAGCVAEPTFYLEGRKGSVGLKCYVRHQKQPGGGFGGLCVRLEWTLTGKPALTRHLGGNRIDHLAAADLNAFLKRNLRLERVDHVALGNLLFTPRPIPPDARAPWNDPNYRAKRAAFLALRNLAYREGYKFGDSTAALRTCRDSPAQIRGYLRELREGKRPRKRGRPKDKSRYRPITAYRPITDYRIDACFQAIDLVPVSSPGIIISTQPKSLPLTAGNSNACQDKINNHNPHQPEKTNSDSRDEWCDEPDWTNMRDAHRRGHIPTGANPRRRAMSRRLNWERVNLTKKTKLSLSDEREFMNRDRAARWLEHREQRPQAKLTKAVQPSPKPVYRKRQESNPSLPGEAKGNGEFDETQSKFRGGPTARNQSRPRTAPVRAR